MGKPQYVTRGSGGYGPIKTGRHGRFSSHDKQHSIQELSFYKLFWIFFICCFLGVVVETIWCLLTRHTLESRTGLVLGPFNPVYGFGGVLITLCLIRLRNRRDIWIFLGGMVLGGVFEYGCSLFQEFAFGTVSWDYTGSQLSIGGRTDLMYSFFWGLLGLFWVKDIYPRMSFWIEKIPQKVGIPLTGVLIAFMLVNMGLSALAVSRQAERREGTPPNSKIDRFLDRRFSDEVLHRIYPNMIVVEQTK